MGGLNLEEEAEKVRDQLRNHPCMAKTQSAAEAVEFLELVVELLEDELCTLADQAAEEQD